MTTRRSTRIEGPSGQEARLLSLLDAYSRHDALRSLPGLADIRDELQATRDDLALEIAALLVDLRARGGRLGLAGPSPILRQAPGTTAPRTERDLLPLPVAWGAGSAAPTPSAEPIAAELHPPPEPTAAPEEPPAAAAPLAVLPGPSPDVAPAPSLGLASAPPVTAELLADPSSVPTLTRAVLSLLPTHDADGDIVRLDTWVGERHAWGTLPDGMVVKLLEAVAARLRALQEGGEEDRRVERMFTSLTGFSETRRPGFAWGLSRSHHPVRGTWATAAEDALDSLIALLPIRPLGAEVTRRLTALAALIAERAVAPTEVRSAFDASAGREVRALLQAGVPPHHPALLDVAGPLAESLSGAMLGPVRRAAAKHAQGSGTPLGA